MKCPKCEYLGFDTSDRCRNCGYDFSLLAVATPEPAADLSIRTDLDGPSGQWLDDLDKVLGDSHDPLAQSLLTPDLALPSLTPESLDMPLPPAASPVAEPPATAPAAIVTAAAALPTLVMPVAAAPAAAMPAVAAAAVAMPAAAIAGGAMPAATLSAAAAAALSFEPTLPPPAFRGEPALPLFTADPAVDDEPLIKVPAQPRAPLAVRRTPETPRLRAVPKLVERPAPEPSLDFAEDAPRKAPAPRADRSASVAALETSAAAPRALAAAIDHAILFAIDAVVVYLTLRIAALGLADVGELSILPMAAFLGLLKLAYFTAFTCVGGQTIGKMAAGIRVVGDDRPSLDAAHAIHRALAGAISFLTLGLGFIPALVGAERRALHDRLAHTRVVALPGA
jgi:uncharacterized RDD family membrane protein YckC